MTVISDGIISIWLALIALYTVLWQSKSRVKLKWVNSKMVKLQLNINDGKCRVSG